MFRFAYLAGIFSMVFGCSRPSEAEKAEGGKQANAVFKKIIDRYGQNPNATKIPEPLREFFLVFGAHGIIGNGGFQYLFEGDIPGDPGFKLTLNAHEKVGAKKGYEAFKKAFAVFPNSTPPANIDKRLQIYQSKWTLMDALENKKSPDAMYMDSMNETMIALDAYVESNKAAFDAMK